MTTTTTEKLTLYEVLGVPPTATQQELKKAFRKAARLLHPDVAGTGDEVAMQRVNKAYETLSDEERRREYDLRLLAEQEAENQQEATQDSTPQADPTAPDGFTADYSEFDVDESELHKGGNAPLYIPSRMPVSNSSLWLQRLLWTPLSVLTLLGTLFVIGLFGTVQFLTVPFLLLPLGAAHLFAKSLTYERSWLSKFQLHLLLGAALSSAMTVMVSSPFTLAVPALAAVYVLFTFLSDSTRRRVAYNGLIGEWEQRFGTSSGDLVRVEGGDL